MGRAHDGLLQKRDHIRSCSWLLRDPMRQRLTAPEQRRRLLDPTLTKLATGTLAASNAVLCVAPLLGTAIPRDIMLALLVSEDEAGDAWLSQLPMAQDISPALMARWIGFLVRERLVEERGGVVALTDAGYDVIVSVLEAIHSAQRQLD
jgi:hypothetical protein